MERLLLTAAENPAATLAGLIAMACYAAWPLLRSRAAMLATYLGNTIGFAVHYALIGEGTATAMNVVMAVQTMIAILLVNSPWLRWAYYVLLPVPIALGLTTWCGVPSLLAAAATLLSTLGRMQTSELALRILLLAATPFWAAHDLAVGSLPGLAADLLSLVVGSVMLARCLAARGYDRNLLARR